MWRGEFWTASGEVWSKAMTGEERWERVLSRKGKEMAAAGDLDKRRLLWIVPNLACCYSNSGSDFTLSNAHNKELSEMYKE